MLRAGTWAVGVFGLAMLICRAFPVPWLEPIVLLGLGVAMLFVRARSGLRPRRARDPEPKQAVAEG